MLSKLFRMAAKRACASSATCLYILKTTATCVRSQQHTGGPLTKGCGLHEHILYLRWDGRWCARQTELLVLLLYERIDAGCWMPVAQVDASADHNMECLIPVR